MRRMAVVLLAIMLIAGLSIGSSFASCDCSAGCRYEGDGGCQQTLYQR